MSSFFIRLAKTLMILLALGCVVLAGACSGKGGPEPGESMPSSDGASREYSDEPIETTPLDRPVWVDTPPADTDAMFHIVGMSRMHSTEQDAQNDAERDAAQRFARYTGVDVKIVNQALSAAYGLAGDVVDPTTAEFSQTGEVTNAQVSRLRTEERFVERFAALAPNGEPIGSAWRVRVLVTVPKDEYDRVQEWKQARVDRARELIRQYSEQAAKTRENVHAAIARAEPVAAIREAVAQWNSLQQAADRFARTGWPYADYAEDLRSMKVQFQSLVERAGDSIVIGRPMSRVVVPTNGQGRHAVPVWVWAKTDDGGHLPVREFPMVLETAEGEQIAKANTGADGKALFSVSELTTGDYIALPNADSPILRDVMPAEWIRKRRTRIGVRAVPSDTPGAAAVLVSQLFQIPEGTEETKQLSLGNVTYSDTGKGSYWGKRMTRTMRDELVGMSALKVVAGGTRSAEEMTRTAERLRLVRPEKREDGETAGQDDPVKVGSPAGQAVLDGADIRLDAIYEVDGEWIIMDCELVEAGTGELRGSARTRINLRTLSPKELNDLAPQAAPQYGEPPQVARPIAVELTTDQGDGCTYGEGDEIAYYFTASENAYVLLLNEDSSGAVYQILPNELSRRDANRVHAREFKKFPGEGADFTFRARPPFGSERVWAFALTRPFPELPGSKVGPMRKLEWNMGQVLNYLRGLGQQPGVGYGEDVTIFTTASAVN